MGAGSLSQLSVCVCYQRSPKDVGNFDHQFTCETVRPSPADKLFLMNLDPNVFAGFSYVNPEYVVNV